MIIFYSSCQEWDCSVYQIPYNSADGEHFFLDDHQRLENFAPPGWKNAKQYGSCKKIYTLFLRFRYYPASITFIRLVFIYLILFSVQTNELLRHAVCVFQFFSIFSQPNLFYLLEISLLLNAVISFSYLTPNFLAICIVHKFNRDISDQIMLFSMKGFCSAVICLVKWMGHFRTEVILHELYLQLRRDILNDRIQPKRDLLYDLAAFALQSECSDQPSVTMLEYFDVQHYIPKVVFNFFEA